MGWSIVDGARGSTQKLQAQSANSENDGAINGAAGTDDVTFQSNSFTLASGSSATNGSSEEYIYAAFAGHPGGDLDLLADTPGAPYDNSLNGGGNYCTLDTLQKGSWTLSNGNLTASHSTSSWTGCRATFAPSSGKWYYEVKGTYNNWMAIGIAQPGAAIAADFDGTANALGYANSGSLQTQTYSGNGSYGDAYDDGDIIGVAFEPGGSLIFYKNGVSQGTAEASLASGPWHPAFTGYSSQGPLDFNFGQRAFAYTPPTGYKALNTYNLPDPTITKPNTVFDVRSGNSAQFTVNDLNFQADLIVSKSTSNDEYWIWADAVRGFDKPLKSDTDAAEGSGDAYTSVGSSGFTTDSNWFTNGRTYVSYAWDAGSANVTNDASSTGVGTIDSTYRVNTDAGFSVVTYTGNSTTGASVAHGLNAKPDFIILKSRNYQYNWTVYHKDMGNTHGLYLNTTAAKEDNATFWNDTDPTSSVITLGNDGGTNYNGSNIVAYCWSEVAGYSKFGTFEGNDNVNGPFIYCGFRPRFFMAKNIDATYSWYIFDTARSTYNWSDKVLYPDLNSAETTSGAGDAFDIVSNGIKLRGDGSNTINASGNTYVFAAFAESPFKYANAR